MQMVFHNKGGPGGANSKDEKWHDFYQHDGTKLKLLPITLNMSLILLQTIDILSQDLQIRWPDRLIEQRIPNKSDWQNVRSETQLLLKKLYALQEELDWEYYRHYQLLNENLNYLIEQVPPIQLGERAFEIVMARKISKGQLKTIWFERHNSTPITEIPSHWPDDYRKLVERRIEIIESDPNINLIERPEYKRRWNTEPWDEQQTRALREWLLNRLEEPQYWTDLELSSCAKLADKARQDSDFMQVAEFYRGRPDFDLNNLITELVKSEAVPFLPILRYKETGLRNRKLWEDTWELQRREDLIDARTKLAETDVNYLTEAQAKELKQREIGAIAVPPKYKSSDFIDGTYWRLRGKLDVPKERFISYPHCQREADQSLVIAWAGWDHLQQARAISGYIETVAKQEGWPEERIVPLLAGLLELKPWLLQWHNEIDEEFNMRMGEYFAGYLEEETRAINKTINDLKNWKPKGR